MERTERILLLNNEIEGRLLSSILHERNIPHIIRSYHDSAYDGLFQVHSGWGDLQAPAKYREEILAIYEEIKKTG